MTEHDVVQLSGLKATEHPYAIDTDEIRIAVPELTVQSNNLEDEEVYSIPTTERKYESPPTRGPRRKENNVYERSNDEAQINGRHFTGYFFAKSTDLKSCIDSECDATETSNDSGIVNPVNVVEDENIYCTPSLKRETQNHGTRTKDHCVPPGKKRKRRTFLHWVLFIVICGILALACWAFVNSCTKPSKDSRPSGGSLSESLIQKNQNRSELLVELRNTRETLKELKIELKNMERMSDQRIKTMNISFREKLEQFQRNNQERTVNFTQRIEKLYDPGKFRGPRGYNGSRGERGPPGPEGPTGHPGPARRFNFKSCLFNMTSSQPTTDASTHITVRDTETQIVVPVSCDSNVQDQTKEWRKPGPLGNGGYEYTCDCDNSESKPIALICKIKYVRCTLL